jgi:choline kinase
MKKTIFNSSLWEGKPTKLSILVPTRDMVHAHFSYCLAQLMKTTQMNGIDTYLFYNSSTILLNQRETLIEKAKEVKSDYVLWLDSDMMFPDTAALRLLSHNKDIVSCNYMKRSKPMNTVAYTDVTDWDSWVPLRPQNELVEVEGIGMGCMLMKTSVFSKLEKPYFEFVYKDNSWHGEDFELQRKLIEIGYKIYVDTVLSMDIKHIGLYGYGVNFNGSNNE